MGPRSAKDQVPVLRARACAAPKAGPLLWVLGG